MPSGGRLLPALIVLLIFAVCMYVIWPQQPGRFFPGGVPWPSGHGVKIGKFERKTIRLGLDLQGGTRLLLNASLPEGAQGNVSDAMEGTINVLRKRVDAS